MIHIMRGWGEMIWISFGGRQQVWRKKSTRDVFRG
jgi:hypothetical protein